MDSPVDFKCERCGKKFKKLILLKYHYCSHFRGNLGQFASLVEGSKCLGKNSNIKKFRKFSYQFRPPPLFFYVKRDFV